MGDMGDPTADRRVQFSVADLARVVGREPIAQARVRAPDLTRLDTPMGRKDDEPEPRDARCDGYHAARPPLALAQRWAVRARGRHGRRDRPPARRLAAYRTSVNRRKRRVGRRGSESGRRPCWICARCRGRAAPCGRDRPAPSFLPRLGPQTVVGGQRWKRQRSSSGPCRPLGTGWRRAREGWERCGTSTTPETRHCRSGCSGCSCCGSRTARCPDCCSRTRRAAHGAKKTGDPTGRQAGGVIMRRRPSPGQPIRCQGTAARPASASGGRRFSPKNRA
jgi:hypothetical protein